MAARYWRLPAPSSPHPDAPLASSVQQRGLCLMTIEFLTRFPAAECVVTSAPLDFWDTVFDLFPKTLFQVFCHSLEDPPRPNVIRHAARFDSQLAAKFGARGAPYNLLFAAEDMDGQMNLYLQGKPAAALLLVTQPVSEYLDGELVYPVYSSPTSGLCGLVPSPGQAKSAPYAGYYAAMLGFHATARRQGAGYDRAVEDGVLTAYAKSMSGLAEAGTQSLLVEMTRNQLPRLTAEDALFWEPPPQTHPQTHPHPHLQTHPHQPHPQPQPEIHASEIESLLVALMGAAAQAEKKEAPQNDPNSLVGAGI